MKLTDYLTPAGRDDDKQRILQMFWSNYDGADVTEQSYWKFYLGKSRARSGIGNDPNKDSDIAHFPVSAGDQKRYKMRGIPNPLEDKDAVINGEWDIKIDGENAMFQGIGRRVKHVQDGADVIEVGWLHFYDTKKRETRPAVMCVADKERKEPKGGIKDAWWGPTNGAAPSPPLARCEYDVK